MSKPNICRFGISHNDCAIMPPIPPTTTKCQREEEQKGHLCNHHFGSKPYETQEENDLMMAAEK